jgi:hypothetical protein
MFNLKSYSGDQIKAALSLSIERYPTFAPTIGEFKSLLKDDHKSMSNLSQSIPGSTLKTKELHSKVRNCFVEKNIGKTSRSKKNYA